MKTLFILTVLAFGEPETERNALWAIEGKESCETVAEILSLNSDYETLMCIEGMEE